MNLMHIAQLLIEKIKKDYDGDVSLLHVHGSYVYNDTHELSDLDLYIVPKTQRGFNLGCTFILNNIGWDFWALPWERLEKIANHEWKVESLITEGRVLYYHSKEDLERFNKLKERAYDNSGKADKAKIILQKLYEEYFNIAACDDLNAVRKAVIGSLYHLSSLLALLNGTPVKRGRKYLKGEIIAMTKIPDNFEKLYDDLFTQNNTGMLKSSLYTLIFNTQKLFSDNTKGTFSKETFAANFTGFYEEMIQSYNKIYRACDTGDIYTPLFAAAEITTEIDALFKKSNYSNALPDIVAAYDPLNLDKIKKCAKAHQNEFVKTLEDNNVKIRAFETIEDFKLFLDKL